MTMEPTPIPGKHEVRQWLARRRAERSPLPGREQIQRELGWMPRDAHAARATENDAGRAGMSPDGAG